MQQTCQRYWTAGGTLRNIAPGSGRRKSKCAPSRESSKLSSHFSEQLHVVQPSVLGGVPMVQAGPFPGITHVDSLVVQSLPRLGSGAAETTSLGMLQGGAGPVQLMQQGALLGHPAGGARWGVSSLAELSAGPGGLIRDLPGVSVDIGQPMSFPLDPRMVIVGGPGAGVGADDRLPASMQQLSHAAGQGVNGISPSPSPSPPPALLQLRAQQQAQQQASSPVRQGGGGSQTSQPATAATGGTGNGNGTASEDSDRPDDGCVQQGKLLRPKADPEAPPVPEIGRGEPGAFMPCPASRLLQAAGSLEAAAMGRQGSGSGSLNPSPVPALHPALVAHMQERGAGSSSNSSTGMMENGGAGNGVPGNVGVGAGLVARQVQHAQASQLQHQQQQSTAALHLALLQHQQQQEQQQQQLLTQMALQHHLSQQQLLQQLGSHHHQAELQRSALLGLGPGVTAGWPAGAVHAAPGAFMPTGTAGGLLHPSMVSGVVSVPMPVATTLLHPVAVTAVPQGVGVGSATSAAAAAAGSSGPMSTCAAAAVPGSQDWISMAAASAAAGGATKPQAVHPHQAAAAMAAIQAAVGSGPAGAAPMLAGSVGGGAPSGSAWAAAAAASGPQGLVSSASAVPQLIWTPYASAYGSAPALAGAVGTYTL